MQNLESDRSVLPSAQFPDQERGPQVFGVLVSKLLWCFVSVRSARFRWGA
jgi:hypothetical protein